MAGIAALSYFLLCLKSHSLRLLFHFESLKVKFSQPSFCCTSCWRALRKAGFHQLSWRRQSLHMFGWEGLHTGFNYLLHWPQPQPFQTKSARFCQGVVWPKPTLLAGTQLNLQPVLFYFNTSFLQDSEALDRRLISSWGAPWSLDWDPY